MTTLSEYVRSHPPKGFTSRPIYFLDGEFATFYVSNRRAYAERVDELLTVYRDVETHELTGCKIKGVRSVYEKLHGHSKSAAVSAAPRQGLIG